MTSPSKSCANSPVPAARRENREDESPATDSSSGLARVLSEALRQPASPPMNKNNTPAFTLIELLVVISIIAILALLAGPALTQALTKGQMTGTMNNARQLYLAGFQMATDGAANSNPALRQCRKRDRLIGCNSDAAGLQINSPVDLNPSSPETQTSQCSAAVAHPRASICEK